MEATYGGPSSCIISLPPSCPPRIVFVRLPAKSGRVAKTRTHFWLLRSSGPAGKRKRIGEHENEWRPLDCDRPSWRSNRFNPGTLRDCPIEAVFASTLVQRQMVSTFLINIKLTHLQRLN